MFSFIYTHVTILFLLRVSKMMDGSVKNGSVDNLTVFNVANTSSSDF